MGTALFMVLEMNEIMGYSVAAVWNQHWIAMGKTCGREEFSFGNPFFTGPP